MRHAIYRLIFLLLSVLYTKKMGAIGYLNEQDIRNMNIDKISDKNCKDDITQEKFSRATDILRKVSNCYYIVPP